MSYPEPVVKWAGGKRQLLDRIGARTPQQFGRYFEPFFGGGAVFFDLHPDKVTVNDINSSLMSLYTRIKEDPEGVIHSVSEIDAAMPKDKAAAGDFFYKQRERYNELMIAGKFGLELDALMLFLNKHCFNGLYRVNSKGLFNVPFNGSTRPLIDAENIRLVSAALQNAKLLNTDFEAACQDVQSGDFVFFDSPYAPIKADTFQDYTKEGFAKEDHERLASLFRRLDKRGAFLMLTNHNTALIRELYNDYHIETVSVRRAINSDASKRYGTEVIVTNYEVMPR